MEVGILTESGNGKCEATNININEAIQNENYTTIHGSTPLSHFPHSPRYTWKNKVQYTPYREK